MFIDIVSPHIWDASAGGRNVSSSASRQTLHTPSSMLGREYILQCDVSSEVVLRMIAPYTKFNVGINTFYS